MLCKLISITMSALILLSAPSPAWASSYKIEKIAPEETPAIDSEHACLTVTYDEAANLTRYTLTLKENAPVTADDVLFTLYVYLDPGYTGSVALDELNIPGLRSYQLQLTDEQISAGRTLMSTVSGASFSYDPTDEDGWTEETRQLYWGFYEELDNAQQREFPILARHIVDYCTSNPEGFTGAFGLTAEEILADDGLKIAYTMVRWGYASYKDGKLTTTRSRTVFDLDNGVYPILRDFTSELRQAHNGDFASCWAIECPNPSVYNPVMPDLEASFLTALYEDERTAVSSIEGIRRIDAHTIEVCLTGVDMRSDGALFSVPMLSLADCGDAALWNPESGLYGHAFGDVSAIGGAHGIQIYQSPADPFYNMN